MKRWLLLGLVTACGASAPTEPKPARRPPPTGDLVLTVRVEGLRSSSGSVRVALFDSEEGFPGEAARAVRSERGAISDGRARVAFDRLGPGSYAVAVLHDENDNGELDTGFLGIPSEGLGASNDAQGRFGPADWDEARFSLERAQELAIRVRYFP